MTRIGHSGQAMITRTIKRLGVTVTFPDGTTAKALLVNNLREISRFERQDISEPDKKPFIWVFAAADAQKVMSNMDITVAGDVYKISSPLHKKFVSDVLVSIAAPSYRY